MDDDSASLDVDAPDDAAVLDDDRSRVRDRDAEGSSRVRFVELFYDLVFVFAITQLAAYAAGNLTAEGLVRASLLFVALWWLWINTTWTVNRLDPDTDAVRLAMFALLGASFVLSMALGDAFGGMGLAFALPYVAMQVGRGLFAMQALRAEGLAAEARVPLRQALWFALTGLLWIGGALVEGDTRILLWAAALAIDLAAPWIGYLVPGLGRSQAHHLDVEGEHLSERCGLFIILTLGETLLVTGARAAALDWTAAVVLSTATAVAGTLAMWWLYFDTGAKRGTRAFEETEPARLAQVAYTYLHIPIVAGIVLMAVGDKGLLDHPGDAAGWTDLVPLLGGPALFILGNFLFKNATSRRWPVSHLAGLAALAAFVPLGLGQPVGTVALMAVGTLIGVAVLERALLRSRTAARRGVK